MYDCWKHGEPMREEWMPKSPTAGQLAFHRAMQDFMQLRGEEQRLLSLQMQGMQHSYFQPTQQQVNTVLGSLLDALTPRIEP